MSGLGSDLQAECEATVFRTLDRDLHQGPGDRSEVLKRVCIATPDILGPVKNGGIGTAFHHLARALAEWGHDVVIAYVGRNAVDERLMQEARAFYSGLGVAFEPIVPRSAGQHVVTQVAAPTWTLLEWLRGRERYFDIVHVSDWRGLGYGPLLAKSMGLAFGTTHFVVHGHAPTLWEVEGNLQLLSTEYELGWAFMEQRSVELADTVTCGSAHLLEWMRDAGYAMPVRSLIWPNPFPVPDSSPTAAAEREARDGARLDEVVFFGRLEPRKGLIVFINAIDRLVRQSRAPARVTFLGKVSTRIDGPGFIQSSARDWPIELRTVTDFGAEEAVAYLSQPGRFAVLPSLQENSSLAVTECLHAGIPFIAAATGGTPELIAPEHRAHALVAPDHIALGERIAEIAGAPLRAVRPRWDFEGSLEVWSRWHAQTAILDASTERFAQRADIAGAATPLVTVCIVHHERPKLVRMAVDSVLAQDYPALEAVLVDDGSESTEAIFEDGSRIFEFKHQESGDELAGVVYLDVGTRQELFVVFAKDEALASRTSRVMFGKWGNDELEDDWNIFAMMTYEIGQYALADSALWRENSIRTCLERDLPTLWPRIPAQTLRCFWTMLAHVQGRLWNAAALARSLAVHGKTVARYVDLMVDLLLVRRLTPFHANVRKRLVKSPKVYVRDSGIVHTLLRLDDADSVLGHPVAGASWDQEAGFRSVASCPVRPSPSRRPERRF